MTQAIASERLFLTPYLLGMVSQSHIDWLNDKEALQYSEQRHKEHTLDTQREYLDNRSEHEPTWLIKWNGADVGTIAATMDPKNHVANIGVLIERHSWGHGFGLEAWLSVTAWLFCHDMRKTEAGCMASNVPMRDLAKKAGMFFEGQQQRHFYLGNGRYDDLLWYGRFR